MGLKAVANLGSGGGGGGVSGSGTAGTIPVWSSSTGLGDSAVTQVNGVILSVALTNGGTGYTSNTYSQVALTNVSGSGTGATADIVVAGGIVTVCALRSPGSGYAIGDTLSSAAIGGGSGFVVTVSSVGGSARCTGNVAAPRVGAGTTAPLAGVDSRDGVYVPKTVQLAIENVPFGNNFERVAVLANTDAEPSGVAQISNNDVAAYGVVARMRWDYSALTTGRNSTAGFFQSRIETKTASGTADRKSVV